MNDPALRLQVQAILVSPERLLSPGQIVVKAGRIIEVSQRCDSSADIRLDGFALLPQLVNPHTHLEFSTLSEPLPVGTSFPQWIQQVLNWRRARDEAGQQGLATAVASGIAESTRASVACLADIVSPPWGPETLQLPRADVVELKTHWVVAWQGWPKHLQEQLPLEKYLQIRSSPVLAGPTPRVLPCLEQLGLSEARWHAAVQWRDGLIEQLSKTPGSFSGAWALSPHAPYSVHRDLLRATIELARTANRMTVMHLAESPAERQWLDSASGPMADMLEKLGAHERAHSPPKLSDIIELLAQSPRALLIHGNYLSGAEMDSIVRYREQMSVVYCPRTHQHFQHQAYPWPALIKRGIRVVIGTDSRSTNPDLNLWQDARAALREHNNMSPTQAWGAVSSQAAAALGIDDAFGSLEVGRQAALCLIPVPAKINTADAAGLLAHAFEVCQHPIPL